MLTSSRRLSEWTLQEFPGSLCFVISSINLSLVYLSHAETMTSRELFTHWRYVDQLQMSEQMYSSLENNYLLRRSWSWERQESLCLAILSTKLSSVCSLATEVSQTTSMKRERYLCSPPVQHANHGYWVNSLWWWVLQLPGFPHFPRDHQVAGDSARDQY